MTGLYAHILYIAITILASGYAGYAYGKKVQAKAQAVYSALSALKG